MNKYIKSALALAATAMITAAGHALTYDASVHGLSAPTGVTHSAVGGDLVVDTKNGVTFLGVQGGFAGSEVDLGQSLEIVFDNAVWFESITFGLVFDGPEYWDLFEIVAASADGNVFTLTADTEDTATWSYAGAAVTNISPAIEGLGGIWEVANPFGSMMVKTLSIYPVSADPEANVADFGLVSYTVPDSASTLVLLGGAILGIVGISRRYGRR